MNAEILTSGGIDYARGVARFLGRAHLYEKSLGKFSRDTTFARIQEAYGAGDMEKLFAGVHEIKGVCGNIALTDLYGAADAMVQMLRAGGYSPEELDGAYARLEAAYGRAHGAILAAMEETT